MSTLEIWKSALSDRRIHIDYLDFEDKSLLDRILRANNRFGDFFVSEWEHPLLGGKLEYHLHTKKRGEELRTLYDQGRRCGNPSLLEVYSRVYIEEMY